MAINSMTGFGRGEAVGKSFTVTVEMKSVNNRFRDFRFKMGQVFSSEEISFRKKIEEKLKRGTFDVFINYKKNQTEEAKFELDSNKIKNFIELVKDVSEPMGVNLSINPTEFLRNDFFVDDDAKDSELLELVKIAFSDALNSLVSSRIEEGEKLVQKLKEHIEAYKNNYKKIYPLKDNYQQIIREKLQKKFKAEAEAMQIDEGRFNQELIYYLEKLDIEEELNRIDGHLIKFDSILNSKNEIGRELEFLLQELGRESNTIGSKSGSSEISSYVVQMKVYLEKIREQALNLE